MFKKAFSLVIFRAILASAYGSQAYNSNTYNGTNQAGILPATGSVIWLAIFGLCLAVGIGTWVWLNHRSKKRHAASTNQSS